MKESVIVAIVLLLPISFVIPLLFLLRKENHIAKGFRSDFSESDRNWMIVLMLVPSVLVFLLLLLLKAADTVGAFLLLWLSTLLKNGLLPILAGIAALSLHAQNRKTLAQPNVTELQAQTRRRSDLAQKRLMVALPVLAVVGIAIALVWRFCFPEKLLWLGVAYFVYINLGAFWIIKISRTKDEEE